MEEVHESQGKGPLRALAYPQFRLFWAISFASIVSFFMAVIARGWLVLDMSDSTFLVTAINAVGMLPMLVFSLFGGAIADRINRRVVLVISDFSSFLLMAILSALIISQTIHMWHVFVLTLVHGTVFALGMPTRAATVSSLVRQKDVASGVALFTTIFSSAQLVGPALAGYLINAYGMGVPFVACCVVLVPAIVLLRHLKIETIRSDSASGEKISLMESINEGFRYVRRSSLLLGLMLMGLSTTIFAMPYQTLLPVFARDILEVGPSGLGWMGAMGGVGAITGSITVATFSNINQMKTLMIVGGVGLGVGIVMFAICSNYLLSLVLLLSIGFLLQIFMTSNFTLVQIISPEYIRGRVLSIRMIALGMGPLGMFLFGAGSEAIGPVAATAFMAALAVLVMMAIVLAISAIRKPHIDAGQSDQ